MKTIVFDFDKTLTNIDTLSFFFKKKIVVNKRYLLLPFYFFLKVISKFSLISVKREKEIMLNMVLKYPKYTFQDLTVDIVLNKVYDILAANTNAHNVVVIISASPEEYLKILFPNCLIFGLQYAKKNDSIKIIQHPYGIEKKEILLANNITHIDEFYYDSKSDEVLIEICDAWNKIKNGVIIMRETK